MAKPKPKPKPKTPAQLVQEVLGPQIRASNTAYANKGASLNAAYQAAAELQKGVAPAVQEGYDAASAREAVIAKGLQVGAQLAGAQTAGASNELLAKQGSPQQVQAANIGAPLATLGGLSAQTLNQQGAAFGAAAKFLPTESLNLGIDALKQSGLESLAARGALEAQRPGLVTQARGQLAEAAAQQEGLRQNEIALRAKLGDTAFDQNVTVERLKNERARIGLSSGNLRLAQSKERFDQALAGAKLNLDTDQYALALKRERRMGKPKAKGGFTAKQKQELSQIAVDTARDDFLGYEDDEGKPVPPRAPVETLRDLIASDVPFSVAIRAIQRFARGTKPAEVDPQTWALWRATLGWTKRGKRGG